MNKKCIKCKELKDISEYRKDIQQKDKLCKYCKSCYNIIKKNYYLSNKEKVKSWNKKWQNNNIEYLSIYHKNYIKDNKEHKKKLDKIYHSNNKIKIIEQKKIYTKNKYNSDLLFRLKSNLRSRIFHALKGNIKSKSSLKLLGCTIEECKQHIESQFKPEMNWENHGQIWEIDHIKPCSSFDLTKLEEQQKCFHYLTMLSYNKIIITHPLK